MAYPVTKVITEAYFDAGVVARQFEELQGYQLNDGLDWLNQILGDKAMDTGDIPYITVQYPLRAVAGQEKYFIPNLINIDTITFYITGEELGFNPNDEAQRRYDFEHDYDHTHGINEDYRFPDTIPDTVRRPPAFPSSRGNTSVRYQMNFVDRNRYFGLPRADHINALPVSYTYERVPGGAMLWVYFPPQKDYLFHITGNFFMQNVSLGQDLTAATSVANLGTPLVTGTPTNLGTLTILGTGTLAAGELVMNGVDLAGTYTTAALFVAYINTGGIAGAPIVAGITATLIGGVVTLTGTMAQITLKTLGTVTTDGLTFTGFATNAGPITTTFNQVGALLPCGLVINGIDFTGSYPTIGALVTAINTRLRPYVYAQVTAGQNAQFTLTGTLSNNITVATNGRQYVNSTVNFSYFSTTAHIPLNQTYVTSYLDQFYINYLEYQLAERICQKLNFEVPAACLTQLERYRLQITKMAEPLDLVAQKISSIGRVRGINYAAANIGRGYTTNGY